MKCPMCDGTGWNDEIKMKCYYCNGMGEIEETNEDWIKSLNTEDFAKAITNIEKLAKIEQIEWWLKQPHITRS